MKIVKIQSSREEEAKNLIFEGMKERFGSIDHSLNKDLQPIRAFYNRTGYVFLTGIFEGKVVGTGALSYESPGVGRIGRMSVKAGYRRRGLARKMLRRLEEWGEDMGYKSFVMETNEDWTSAIALYRSCGYRVDRYEDGCVHFIKNVEGTNMSFKFKSIDHIQLAAPKGSEEEARRFFAGLLGFEEVEKPEVLKKRGGVWFAFGSYQVHIGIEEPFAPAQKAHPAFEIDNLDGLIKHLDEHEVSYKEDDDLPGAKRIYMDDPFGNRIEILEWV
ncbi:GNAT family N-acetyltransferase [Bacillus sp. H-16]|nr:GNAT family N-acetyltransferase [Alteribacter salitolerans]